MTRTRALVFIIMLLVGIQAFDTVKTVQATSGLSADQKANHRLATQALGFAQAIETNQEIDTQALCSLRADVEKRVASGNEFLKTHPGGIPGIPAPALRLTISNSQRTITALSSLVCPK